MSYRELRDFTEHMKTLGYPSALSIDSFRQPNFPLVASLLLFLLHRYDPTLVPPEDISSQSARISFVQAVTALLLSKCHIKLSMKQIYKADGYAVKELLKLSTTLYNAMQTSSSSSSPSSSPSTSPSTSSSPPSSTFSDSSSSSPLPSFDVFKDAKSLSSDLIDLGERLSSLLSHEPTIRTARDAALLFVDSLSTDDGRGGAASVERSIRRQMAMMADNVGELKASQAQVSEDVDKVRVRVERKEGERERLEKRWAALRRVKPAFMEEFEREEKELRVVYAAYVERMRNVQWLEGEMKGLRREEEEEKKESEKQLSSVQKRLREEEMKILRGAGGDHAMDDTDEEEEEEEEGEEGEGEGEEDEEEGDEKRGGGDGGGYERKEERRGEDEDEEEQEEEEEDDDEDEEKRPSRGRGAPGRASGDRSVIRGRGSASTGRKKGRSLSGEEAELMSESDASDLGEDDYF